MDEFGIKLGLEPRDSNTLKLVWNGFRNKLAHVSNIEFGKQVMVYVIEDPDDNLTVNKILSKIEGKVAFKHDGYNRNWRLNADNLLAKLPLIKKNIIDQICQSKSIDYDILEKIIG